jgi:ribosomal protein S17E
MSEQDVPCPDPNEVVTRSILKEVLADYPTKEDLRNELERFATKEDLRNELASYATKEDLRNELASYATKEDLRNELASYATKEDLRNELERFATKEDLRNELASYATKEDLAKLDAKVETYFGALLDRLIALESYVRTLPAEFARQARGIAEEVRGWVNAVDDKYADLPARVSRLEMGSDE